MEIIFLTHQIALIGCVLGGVSFILVAGVIIAGLRR